MKKNKLKLNDLKVESFTTTDANSIKGGVITFVGCGTKSGCLSGNNCDENVHSMDNGIAVPCKPPVPTSDCETVTNI